MVTFLRAVHVVAASIWVGGTIALVFVGVPVIRRLEGETRATAMRTLGRRWRPLGWSAMGVAILSGLWLSDRHGAFHHASLSTAFDTWLIAKSAVVAALVLFSLVHDFLLGPRLQREIKAEAPRVRATRLRLIVVGWVAFVLTIAAPVLGIVLLSYLD